MLVNKAFNYDYYIKRNEEVARELYGDRLDETRCVIGTNVYFDGFWRFHKNDQKEVSRC